MQVLALTERVWQRGEAFDAGRAARRGSGRRGRSARAGSVSGAVARPWRSAGARALRREGRPCHRRRARSNSTYGASVSMRPARRSAVTRIASACGPSSASGLLRCSRTPRSTCAIASRPKRSTRSIEEPELDAPTFDERQRLERVAPARVLAGERLHHVGELREQQATANGRATSSVTRPPPVGAPSKGRW